MTVACFSIAVDMNFYAMFGWFGAQGRHIAPILVGAPLLIVTQASFGNRFHNAIVISWSVVMVWAGLGALRRYTVGVNGNNALSMFSERAWSPTIGFWFAVMMLISATATTAAILMNSENDRN
jgi:hypothetical protein